MDTLSHWLEMGGYVGQLAVVGVFPTTTEIGEGSRRHGFCASFLFHPHKRLITVLQGHMLAHNNEISMQPPIASEIVARVEYL